MIDSELSFSAVLSVEPVGNSPQPADTVNMAANKNIDEEFKRVASIMKKQVKEGTLDFGTFDMWYLDMRCEIDALMEKHGLGKYM